MVDADIANPIVGNTTHPLVFWLVTNIREGNMSTGTDSSVVLLLIIMTSHISNAVK